MAAVPRLVALDLAPFKADEAAVLNHAAEIAVNHATFLVGPKSSTGLFTPPLPLYLLALPMGIARDAVHGTAFVALTNVLAVVLLARLLERWFDRRAALIGGLLYAVSFWSVIFSRRVWDVSLAPLFAVLFVTALADWLLGRRPRSQVWAALWLGLLLQTHFSTWGYVLLVPLVVLLGAPVRWRLVPLALAVAAASWLPFLLWEAQNGWPDWTTLRTLLGSAGAWDLNPYRDVTVFLSAQGMGGFWAPAQPPYLEEGPLLLLLRNALVVLFWASLAYVALRAMVLRSRPGPGRGHALLLGWALLPLVAFVHRSYPLIFHYLFPAAPALFAVLGVGLAALTRTPRSPQLVPLGVALYLAVHAGGQLWALGRFLRWVDSENVTETYGVPLKYSRAAAEAAKAISLGRQVYLVGHGDDVHIFAFHFWGHAGIKPVDDRSALVVPRQEEPVAYIVPAPLANAPVAPVSAFVTDQLAPAQTITYPGRANGFALHSVAAGDGRAALLSGLQPVEAALSNGVVFRGARLITDDRARELTLLLAWEVASVEGDVTNQRFFNHAVDSGGRQVAQWDGIGYPGWAWRPGDLVLSWHRLSLPGTTTPGAYWVRVGMYDSVTLRRTELRVGGERPSEDFVAIGPVEVTSGR